MGKNIKIPTKMLALNTWNDWKAFSGEANGFILVLQHITSPLQFTSLIPLQILSHSGYKDSTFAAANCPELTCILQLLDLVLSSLFPLEITHTCDLKALVWLPAFRYMLLYLLLFPSFLTFYCF